MPVLVAVLVQVVPVLGLVLLMLGLAPSVSAFATHRYQERCWSRCSCL